MVKNDFQHNYISGGTIDWDRDGIDDSGSSYGRFLAFRYGDENTLTTTSGDLMLFPTAFRVLKSFNDWDHIVYKGSENNPIGLGATGNMPLGLTGVGYIYNYEECQPAPEEL